jgi:hypothetical protein
MGMSTSRLAFSDCYELMEKAIVDQKGIRIKFASMDDAWHYRLRLHNARKIDRNDNMQLYEDGHKMHGKSPYDVLVMRLESIDNGKEGCWLKLEKLSIDGLHIESLSTVIPVPKPPPKPVPIPIIERVETLPFKRRI